MRAFGVVIFYLIVFLSFKVAKDPAFDYILSYANIATKEMERSGVPASIKLAQGLLESENGKSILATNGNNHFGIKCGKDWKGKTFYKNDDDADIDGNNIESCFRAFDTAEESFIAHSEFLKDPKKNNRYGFLFSLDKYDYKSWAIGLRNAGYATDPSYPNKLIKIIEKYELFKYDNAPIDNSKSYSNTEVFVKSEAVKNNEIQKPKASRIKTQEDKSTQASIALKKILVNNTEAILIPQNITVENISKSLNIKVSELLAFNEILYSPDQIIFEGTYIYTERKNKDYEGIIIDHKMQKGESLEAVANLYGMRVNTLYALNRIPKGNQPLDGEIINLKEKVDKKKTPKYKKENKTVKILFSLVSK